MKSMSVAMKYFAFLFLTILFTISNAGPISATMQKRDVFVPPITNPTNATVWNSGEVQTVSWDTSAAPVNITNKFGRIQLRQNGNTFPLVLADGFDILLGSYNITVPLLITGVYELVLFGDSGNFSPDFTINGVSE
ncbi:hypothetical protein J3R30DRAFT_3455306 [Lentinula aciculospora]|uniref:Uncharacterized protein n=1 Tax=Lentinula aciculospora TaxID=153920 RepID=A0A9W9AG76_9AGAR|nr:hypothetical protein J3R30DRAFT_3455306 [Lentinula aciculospora]